METKASVPTPKTSQRHGGRPKVRTSMYCQSEEKIVRIMNFILEEHGHGEFKQCEVHDRASEMLDISRGSAWKCMQILKERGRIIQTESGKYKAAEEEVENGQ